MSAGGSLRHPSNPNRRLEQTQAQVDEVVGIMKTNVSKVLERQQNLSELDNRADKLKQASSGFENHAGKLKLKYQWKNLKMMLILAAIIIITIVIIIVSFTGL